jgi:predicted CXXCH cytochrome family protein
MGWNHWFGHGAGSRRRIASVAAGLAIAVVGGMTGITASAQTATGIAATKHNLGSTGTGVNKFSGTAEICVFCHTPHGADTTAAVPLWNRTLTGTTYTTYDSLGTSTLDGKVAAVGSVSIACLSCHDGTQAMNTVINAPGSGAAGDAAWRAGAWSGANQTAGKITSIANLGTDLTNDHPVGIQYGGGGYSLSAKTGNGLNASGTTDPDFKPAATALIGSTQVWWVDTGTTGVGSRQKSDMMLYTRSAAAGYTSQTTDEPFVECASCHDPHTNDNPTFLRISNAGSAVCLSCHVK